MKSKFIVFLGFLAIIVIMMASCQSEEAVEFNRYYAAGSLIYRTHCQNCHGANGEGLLGLIPPLNDGAYLKTYRAQLPCSVKYGLKGKLTIGSRLFEGQMPANDLGPIDIAMVLTYVTNSFGNKTGIMSSNEVNVDLAKCQ